MNNTELTDKLDIILGCLIGSHVGRATPEHQLENLITELKAKDNEVLGDVSYDEIDISWLMDKHPELYENEAESLQQFCFDHTIRLKECYGNGENMYPKWKQR